MRALQREGALDAAATTGLDRHGLGLHGIHAGQPANPGLVQFDDLFGLLAGFTRFKKLLFELLQTASEVF